MELSLLPKAYEATTAVLVAVTDWEAPSPCTEWTVGQVLDHLVEVHHVFAAAVDGGPPTGAGGFAAAAERCLAAFGRPGALTGTHPFAFGPTPGSVIAGISLSETLVHGWDIARGAGVPYEPSPEVVAAILAGAPAPEGLFTPVPPADDAPLTVLLARTGRVA
jgi:uncharacterized protein (TIGR03086 family)